MKKYDLKLLVYKLILISYITVIIINTFINKWWWKMNMIIQNIKFNYRYFIIFFFQRISTIKVNSKIYYVQ